ncbi:hypothetical protein ACFW95_39820 [Streptomyces sp. NPDC059474]|uniref:hypothetical protein n=1 Tax=unclassified Streptomyces TaxID=2593676 RepID=UPI001ABD10FA|nr:hypothetical protein [Streptomyces sp. NEAU-YJ-81]MBO3674866.1 hypothetical protein [Streptomyces sp. NEAU-YJ-81]
MGRASAPLGTEDAPFIEPLSAVLADVLEPDPDGSVLVIGLHKIVLSVMHRRFGHGVPISTLKRVLRATGLVVRAPNGEDSRVYGVNVKPYQSGAPEAA